MKKVYIFGGVIVLLSVISIGAYKLFAFYERLKAEDLPSTYLLTIEDSVIQRKFRDKVSVREKKNSKTHCSVIFLNYYNINSLVAYKMPYNNRQRLSSIITYQCAKTQETDGILYRVLTSGTPFYITCARGDVPIVKTIKLTYDGNKANTVLINDSIVFLKMMCNNFSLSYNGRHQEDLVFNKNLNISGMLSVELAFFKDSDFIYVFILSNSRINEKNILFDDLS